MTEAEADDAPLDSLPREQIRRVEQYVQRRMAQFDASHDYDHIKRVVALARHIFNEETKGVEPASFSWPIVHLSALVHDVFDHKYTSSAEFASLNMSIAEFLCESFAVAPEVAAAVGSVVENESYSFERDNPSAVRQALEKHPELGIVQDADRLDALGAIGIGRAFCFGGACGRRGEPLAETVKHFKVKLELLEACMKTETGKRLARKRTERLKVFGMWWDEELALASQDVLSSI